MRLENYYGSYNMNMVADQVKVETLELSVVIIKNIFKNDDRIQYVISIRGEFAKNLFDDGISCSLNRRKEQESLLEESKLHFHQENQIRACRYLR